MSPKKIFIYIIAVLAVMFGLTYLSGSVQYKDKESSGFSVLGGVIKYPTTAGFFMTETISKETTKKIDNIVGNIEKLVTTDTEDSEGGSVSDTLPMEVPNFADIDTSQIQRIQYPANATAFISKLKQQLQSGGCRIIHYGDSQLEGDRISAYLRNRLQGLYGGGGPGFIPIKQVYQQLSADVTCGTNWLRYAAFDPTQKKFSHGMYGVYTSLSRFTKPLDVPVDSIDIDTLPMVNAQFTVGVSKKSYANLRNFTKVTLHYGNAQVPAGIKVFNDDVLLKADSLKADGKYHAFTITVPEPPTNLRFELNSKISPDFYGLTLDSKSGLTLDNVAMRGASGTVFVKLSGQNFSSMLGNLNPDVFIFQYGGNTVPYLKDSLDIDNYARYVLSNVNWVRQKAPDATFLFIGPSDMTTSQDGVMFTYTLLPYLNDKLRETCLANNIAYWDMFNAMGGENSMQHWVDQGLAGTDYTHFTPKGTKIISELFFISLYLDLSKK